MKVWRFWPSGSGSCACSPGSFIWQPHLQKLCAAHRRVQLVILETDTFIELDCAQITLEDFEGKFARTTGSGQRDDQGEHFFGYPLTPVVWQHHHIVHIHQCLAGEG